METSKTISLPDTTFRARVIKGFLWLGTGTFIGQGISWISTLLVIRLLAPSDYGLMAMASSLITLSATISEFGVGSSLIQAREINETQIRQVFAFSLIAAFAGAVLSYLAAPLVALFYKKQELVPVIRVMNINFILIALYIIPQALFIRELNFRTKAKVDVSAQIVSSLVMLILALIGMGIWALVIGQLGLHATKAGGFTIARRSWWKPLFRFSGAENLMRYGVTVTGDRLIYNAYALSDSIIIGKFLGNHLLGIYAVALNLASIPLEKIMPLVTQVTFTSYSRIQDDRDRIRKNILKSVRIIAYSSFPLFFGMAGVADVAIPLLLGTKWAPIIMPFQLLCLILPLKAIGPLLPPAVFAIGHPKFNVVNMIITAVGMSISFFIGVRTGGIVGVCLAWVIAYPLVFLVTSARSLRLLVIALPDFYSKLVFPFISSSLMFMMLILVKRMISLQPVPALLILILLGAAFYIGSFMAFKRGEYLDLKSYLREWYVAKRKVPES